MNKFTARLKFLKFSDLRHIFLFLLALPISVVFKFFHKDLWLICEDGTMARDNGYWLFKYICQNHPEIDVVYAITKNSPDYNKVSSLGTVIPFGSFVHWIYYIAASKNIFSAKLGKPSPAICFPLEMWGLLRSKRIFLQHGIIKDDMKSLYYDVCKFSLFITSAQREQNFVEHTFGYSGRNIVKLLGLCRFDNLINSSDKCNAKQILLMPTWRDWLGSAALHTTIIEFQESDYFKMYQSFLQDKRLKQFLEENEIRLVFFPHKGMQKFLSAFHTDSPNIVIADWKVYDVQQLLIESAFCITDYSSIAMDFAYMEKPLVYFQFDYQRFRSSHYGEGYFSYKADGFGEICYTEKELVELIEQYGASDFKMKAIYKRRVHDFFTLHDNKNCERNFNAIKAV
ncbi:MAG: teichoic acid biosynthesis protein B [Treponema sp.]|nr:teichoic acid biosynthesis protein B [Treponema sp.]